MGEVKILDKVFVDVSENVEKAIQNLTGKRVKFDLIRNFITNEKNTMFYLDKKMNSSTAAGYYTDYLWLDTGFRDRYDNPILICLHNSNDGYVGHYTGTIKELCNFLKSYHRKNTKEIAKNYSRFINKYNNRVSERTNVYVSDPLEYAAKNGNEHSDKREETAFSLAFKCAGIKVEDMTGEVADELVVQAADPQEEEINEIEKEITIGLLVEQMESMQKYIDELLLRIENNEKTSYEEIERLKTQNQEYKKALVNIRLFNSENEPNEESPKEDRKRGHNLLERNKKILVFGNSDIRISEMRAIARDDYGFEKNDFEFMIDYEKIKSAGYRIHNSDKYVAVIFGNCPHKVAGIGNYSNIIEEFKQRDDCPISVDARTKSGDLKITKQSFREALTEVCKKLIDKVN